MQTEGIAAKVEQPDTRNALEHLRVESLKSAERDQGVQTETCCTSEPEVQAHAAREDLLTEASLRKFV